MDNNLQSIAVLGSGVAGTAIAYELANAGHRVFLLYRKANEGSSFTNQKWQHSGLLYSNKQLVRNAWGAYQKMNPLLRRFTINRQVETRLLALNRDTLEDREHKWHDWDVKSWGLDWRLLDTSEYKEIGDVGITRAVGGFATPDCVIDFPKLIAHLRRMAKDRGAHIIEGADVRKLKMDKGDKRIVGLEYDTNDGHRELDCKYCIVAMGAWSVKLLDASGVTLPPIIRKKCIVLTYEGELVPCITVCLDVQKESGAKSDVTLVPFKEKR